MNNQMFPVYQQPPQIVSVRSEAEARNYPVGYGNSVTFKDETAPYIYTKTMGFSQLERPVFEKFKLVREDTTESPRVVNEDDSLGKIRSDISALWKEINALKGKRGKNNEHESNV